MNGLKRMLSVNSQADAENHETKKAKLGNDTYIQPRTPITQEWHMTQEANSNYTAREHRLGQSSSTVNDGVRILEHAQGVVLDKCTINAASRDMIFITNQETGMSINKYKQWLSPPDPSTNFNNALKNHLSNTGSWLLNSPAYLEWKQGENSFLWVHGISGSGKTILCSTLIQAIQEKTDNRSSGLAYFFCDVSDINKRTARGLLCSLVLALLTPQNQSMLEELFEKCKDGLQKPTDYDLYGVLKSYLSGFQDVYLFIDALDECTNVEEVLELVKLINGWRIRSCHLLFTSRKEMPIANSLKQATPSEVDLTLMPTVNQDIAKYIDHMLFSATELKRWNPNAKELIKMTLMEKGKGMFRWVACQLEELKHCSKSHSMLKHKLNSLPTTLESTYDQILTRIEEADTVNAMKLILWLTFSEKPIHLKELALIVEYDVESQQFDVDAKLDYPDDVLKICSSLVTTMGDETVQFAHASIKEYFESGKRQLGSSVIVDPCFGHCFIGQCGLAYILQRKHVIAKSGDDSILFWKSLLRYSACFWPKHILACKQESAVMNQIINLFESQSLTYWVNAYNYSECDSWDDDNMLMIYPNYLQIAALHGLIETAKWLMSWPVNSTECTEALYAAAYHGHFNMVTLILERGKINVTNYQYRCALTAALERGDNQVVRLLCEHGKDSYRFRIIRDQAIQDNTSTELEETSTESEEEQRQDSELQEIDKAIKMAVESAGHKSIVELLLEHGIEVNVYSLRRQVSCALHTAAHHDNERSISLLLAQGVTDPNIPDDIGETLLHVASLKGNKNIIQILIDNGADVNAQGGKYGYAIWAAMSEGHGEIVELLLQHGANTSIHSSYDGEALAAACKGGYINIVQLLLDKGVDPDIRSINDGNALISALKRGNKDIVKLLLEKGAHINKYVQRGQCHSDDIPLHVASKYASKDIVRMLLEWGADVNIAGGDLGTALQAASDRGEKDIVQLLLEWGANVNMQAYNDISALIAASSSGHKPIVELLLEWGADVNTVGCWDTALQAATLRGNKDIVQLLLEWGANVNIQTDAYHGSALIAGSSSGHKPIVELLLEWGADVDAVSRSDMTALYAASCEGKKDCVQLLLEWGANVNLQAGFDGSSLIVASFQNHKPIVELLLEWGADVNIQSRERGSALHAAACMHNTEIAQLLLAHGAKYLGPEESDSDCSDD